MDNVPAPELVGLISGAVITLIIFSYLLDDNFLYRWVLALLVGAGVGYMLAIALRFVLWEWLLKMIDPSATAFEKVFFAVPLILGILLLLKGFALFKFFERISVLGNIALGYLVGVGAAVALSGAILGTVIPQTAGTGAALTFKDGFLGLLQGSIIVVGTISTLLVFSPRVRSDAGRWGQLVLGSQRVGRFYIVVGLAVAFAGAITSGLTALVLRLWQIAELIQTLLVGGA